MRILLAALLASLLIACTQNDKDRVMSESEFTESFIVKLSATAPDLSVQRKGALELSVSKGGEKKHTVFLDNAFKAYRQAPENNDAIVDDYLQSLLETMSASGNETIDTKRIVPVVKDAEYVEAMKRTLVETGQEPEKFDLYYEPLNEDLIVLYAVDSEHNIKYLSGKEVESLAMDRPALRKLAVTNLNGLLPELEKHGESGTYMITAGATYEASLLLMDRVWEKGQFEVRGDIVVAVPSRDLLLVTGSQDSEALARLTEVVQEVVRDASYPITEQLFVRTNGQWVRFKK